MFNQSSWEWFGHGVCALFEERPLCKPRPLPRLWPGQNKPQVGVKMMVRMGVGYIGHHAPLLEGEPHSLLAGS